MKTVIKRWLYMGDERVNLVLHENQAFWFRYTKTTLVDTYAEPLWNNDQIQASNCPWLLESSLESPLYVNLIIDSSLDDLDIIETYSGSSRITAMAKRFFAARLLQREYPLSTQYPSISLKNNNALAILHQSVPECYCLWVESLAKSGVAIQAISSSSEVIIDSLNGDTPRLFIATHSKFTRYLFCLRNNPISMVICGVNENDNLTSKRDSIEKDDNNQLPELNENCEYCLILPDTLVRNLSKQNYSVIVPALAENDLMAESWKVAYLSEMFIGNDVPYYQKAIYSDEPSKTHNESQSVFLSSADIQHNKLENRSLFSRLVNFYRYRKRVSQWNPRRSARMTKDGFQKTLQFYSKARTFAFLKNATVCTAVLSGITLFVSSLHAIRCLDERAEYLREKAYLERSIKSTDNALSQIHPSPHDVVSVITKFRQFDKAQIPEPRYFIKVVTGALSESNAVYIDAINWYPVYELHNQRVPVVPREIPGRSTIPTIFDSQPLMTLIVAGSMQVDLPYALQYDAFQRFKQALVNNDRVDSVTVMVSPSSTLDSNTLAVSNGLTFQLSIEMKRFA